MNALSRLEDIAVFLSDVLREDDDLHAAVNEIGAALRKGRRDTERLDYIEEQGSGYDGWVARQSSEGRGFRLHNSTRDMRVDTARQAIDMMRGVRHTEDY